MLKYASLVKKSHYEKFLSHKLFVQMSNMREEGRGEVVYVIISLTYPSTSDILFISYWTSECARRQHRH